ncbi:serpin peptidase inhibitor, clade A (alpha-1 antiproteinase, antitrypsin), member 3 L homeolog [Xenopus laevis]|uniref:Thyroxine-binding globulin n=1 Tax=Xenopus laevis TaxID=8355 RepID=Q5U539_XENLA|nr:serpin peptidase inhibitor, clade A (alpha-1 antiproteinase, antitrypsin), member 3 L homeolog [Xenopus laevis]AAH84845.1 LOC495377 protein [Xenopus laevis]
MHEAFEHLLQVLNRPKSNLKVKIGNAVFVEDALKILDSFTQEIEHHYHAEIFPSHFKNPAEAEKQINDYVSNKTDGKIQELVKDLSEETKLLLINYIVFKAEWEHPFSSHSTYSGKFSVDDNTTVEVQMMYKTDEYIFFKDEKIPCSVLQLPYKNNASMLLIVPELGKIHEVEEALSVETLKRWKSSAEKRFFELHLPKFSISSSLKLKDILTDMGMGIIFTDSADFSGISEKSRLKISKVVHKAVLDVDEKGTEAAAASAAEAVLTSLMETFNVDRPFITLIYSEEPYSILFMSRVIDPTEK